MARNGPDSPCQETSGFPPTADMKNGTSVFEPRPSALPPKSVEFEPAGEWPLLNIPVIREAKFYNGRGTAEQYVKEGKKASK